MKHIYLFLITLFIGSFGFAQTTIYSQDFETLNDGYTASATEGSGYTDVFNRANPNVGGNSSYIWAIEDTGVTPATISLDQINVTGYTDFTFTLDMLAHHYNDWDSSDTFSITYSLDGGASQNLLWVRNAGGTYNQAPSLDTDFDGVGDCGAGVLPAITTGTSGCTVTSSDFATFSSSTITLSGNTTLDIVLSFEGMTSGDEGMYFDNIEVEATGGVTCAAPTSEATAFSASSVTTDGATLSWTSGNGDNAIVIMKEGSAVDFSPSSLTDYAANTNFSSGIELGTGNYVVYNGNGESQAITGLASNTTYYIAIYEYNDTETCYMSTALTDSFATLANTTVEFTSTTASVSESAGTYDLEFTIANEGALATTFDVVLTSGDASDIDSYTTQSKTFPGSSTTDITVTITVTDDAIIETDEVFTFEIQNVAGGNSATVGTNNTFDLTITNNDFPTTVEFTSSSDSVSEGVGTYDLEFTIANENATATSFEIVLTGGDGDAADINGYTTQTVTFPSGSAVNQAVTLTVTDDALLEANETLTFEIQSVTGGSSAVAGTNNSFTLTLTNNDVAPPISLPYSEDFSNCGTAEWTPYDEAGSNSWLCDSGEYAMNGYHWSGEVNVDWLISDFSIDFDAYASVNIDVTTQEGYGDTINSSGEFELLYSTDYTGGDPTTATWTALSFDPNNTSSYSSLSPASVTSVDASSITGTAYIAFKYDMNFGSGAEDWRVQNIDIYEDIALDADTEVYESMTQIAGNSYYANAITTSATAKDALAFIIEDQGTTDGEPTQVTTMRFVPGPNNTAGWSDHIQGITLYDENFIDYSPTTTITDSELILEFDTPITIADGTALEFFFGFYLNTTNIVDQSIIQFQINETSHGFEADAIGSDFADTLLFEDVVGNNFTIDVYVAQLIFSQQPSNTFVNTAITPDISVAAVDINGNIDTSYNLDIEITSSGTLSGSPLVATPVNGVATFVGVTHTALGTALVLTADDGLYPAITSTPFDIEAIPVAGWQITAEDTAFIIDFDTTVAEVNNGAFDASGFTPLPASGQLDADAWASTGMGDGALNFGDTQTSGDYARGTSTGNVSSGGFYAFETGSGNSTLGFQATSSDFTPGTITLRAQNQTGNTITTADLAYLIYVDNRDPRSNSFDFSYSTDDSSYTNVSALDYASDASSDASGWVSNSKSTSISGLSIADGAYLYLRWSTDEVSGSGNRDEFALDDISLIFNPIAPTTYTFNGTWSPSDPNGAATASDDIVITSGNATISSDTNINSVTVNPGAGLTIDSSVTLTVTNAITLESVSNSYSSLILNGTITGTINYERHVNGNGLLEDTNAIGENDLITPPLSGQTFGAFAAANSNLLTNPGDATEKAFAIFDKSTGDYENYNTTDNVSTLLVAGTGYRAASDNTSTLVFTGTANSGDIDINIDHSGPSYQEWNLIGNPYPSYLDVEAFLTYEVDTDIKNIDLLGDTSGIYGYDGDASDNWDIINLSNASERFMTPGQGFLVGADATYVTTYDLEFKATMRTTGSGDDFIEGRDANTLTYFKLNASTTTHNYTTQFYFNANATKGLDAGYDARIWGGTAPNFALFSHLVEENNGLPIALQALDLSDLSNVTIPLGVNANQGEQLTFSINASTLPNTVSVYLEDNVANTSTLLNTSDYVLTPSTGLSGIGRFYLRFSESALSTIDNTLDQLSIYINKANKTIVIAGQLLEPTTASVYDVQGRLVASELLETTNRSQAIDVSQLNTGIYVVKLHNTSQNKTQKVIIR
ncbi:T9SS type A sorting domain-containing protein [Winogradskyella helgolandensis]|uniref:T9SS type A sorting domain-containing protein n=1 Tax=Winogradskyella helgolandensis TaxID=2697010 RepID=UPI0015BBB9F8|nr:T9SS type A sorting domain-containing protein [Winogradskyella helgolandensis]